MSESLTVGERCWGVFATQREDIRRDALEALASAHDIADPPGNDVALPRQMVRACVSMGMIDEVVSDYRPARVWDPDLPAPISRKTASPS